MSNIVSHTKIAASGREHEVLAALGITPPRRGHMRCPIPGHEDRNPSWRWDERAARYYCSRCPGGDILDLVQAMGHAANVASAATWIRERLGLPPIKGERRETSVERQAHQAKLAEAQRQGEIRKGQRDAEGAEYAARQLVQARWLWDNSEPIEGTLAEAYLRKREITGPLPPTLRWLSSYRGGPGAMIAPFVMAVESEPGLVTIPLDDMWGMDLTFVHDDGSPARNAEGSRKITIGVGHDLPITLMPPLNGCLLIAEGIENALSHQQEARQAGLGVWAAGTANRLPGLARHVPSTVKMVAVFMDNDKAGKTYGIKLADALCWRGFTVLTRVVGSGQSDAA